jgi:hypothetical protein
LKLNALKKGKTPVFADSLNPLFEKYGIKPLGIGDNHFYDTDLHIGDEY